MLKTIISDDDSFMRSALRNILAEIPDIEVIGEAEDGEELVQKVSEKSPDVILLDIDMPKMNGVEAARKIVEINPSVFIVFVTAHSHYTHDAFKVYAIDYIVKPFNKEHILTTFKRIKALKVLGQIDLEQKPNKDKVPIKSNNEVHFVDTSEIILVSKTWRKTIIYTKTKINIKSLWRNMIFSLKCLYT